VRFTWSQTSPSIPIGTSMRSLRWRKRTKENVTSTPPYVTACEGRGQSSVVIVENCKLTFHGSSQYYRNIFQWVRISTLGDWSRTSKKKYPVPLAVAIQIPLSYHHPCSAWEEERTLTCESINEYLLISMKSLIIDDEFENQSHLQVGYWSERRPVVRVVIEGRSILSTV